MKEVAIVVVTYDAQPWLARCLESVRGYDTVVVDHGSTDGTVELVRERFADVRLVEQENKGVGAGWNRGLAETRAPWVFLLNSDAWVLGDAIARLRAFGDAHADVAFGAPRLLNPDGTVQRSVRGFPTLWRLATEFFFLRKLAPRSRALNAFYAARFDHDVVREADWLMGACMLVRADAVEEVGGLDEDFFLFNEESDWCFRFRRTGWEVVFFPGAEVVHVGGAAHGGRMFREQVTSHLRFLAKHRGLRDAERARRLLAVALRIRGLVFRGERGRMYADAARWLSSRPVPALLQR
jgi:N-acetylglucosaminyl-diphospho-decaprenol L-rhamnosyltransferase